MKNIPLSLILMTLIAACSQNDRPLYRSAEFTVYPDRVVQGNYEARVLSPGHITSDYRSTATENYSRLLVFKFSINEKDNEARPGTDHWLLIGDEHESPLVVFGQMNAGKPADNGAKLPVNYPYTFRLDFNPVLKAFREKGWYETWDGSRIAAEDFKGIYIAGALKPLSWDFVNLGGNGLEMKDEDGDGIYELTLLLNPFDEKEQGMREWKLKSDLSARPVYRSDQPLVDALFTMSLEEMQMNIEPDSTFRTGTMWGGVWTRDVSYSTLLALALIEPEVARISLMHKVKRGRIIQDTGSGGAWPVSSDRLTWALAAWEIYKYTGDRSWLETAYPIIRNSLDDDEKTLPDPLTGMNHGESSFLDWREQTYPKWMNNADIFDSENLGTNAVHYRANLICAEMAALLGEDGSKYLERAAGIQKGMNDYLWQEDKGWYGQYLYGRTYPLLSPRSEALGEALTVLFGVAGPERAEKVLSHSPVTAFGITCIYPQNPGIPPYHNNAIWPFVQAYWNLAAAKTGNEEALVHGLAAIYRAGALFLSNYENFVAETGDYVGTEINSDRMLWSMSGNMAMVLRVFCGMEFETQGITFRPVIPEVYGGSHHLSSFRYRGMMLDIRVDGFGKTIRHFSIDGKEYDTAFLPDSLTGSHTIHILMDNRNFDGAGINLVENRFSPANPQPRSEGARLVWDPVPGSVLNKVYRNGRLVMEGSENEYINSEEGFSEYMVLAADSNGLGSFAGEPLRFGTGEGRQVLQMEDFAPASRFAASGFSGKGFIRISPEENTLLKLPLTVAEEGLYCLTFRYANGTGPWNTDNNCAIRTLGINGKDEGVVIFPQRGTGEWSDWGYSNCRIIRLHKGNNLLTLSFREWNINMDGEINEALIDCLELEKL
ncbi:MAG: MGH1-like glycoside hydrolase domain-containing protein [Bacteroidota bacterium]